MERKKDIMQAYLLMKHCDEELVLLSEEKKYVVEYWLYQNGSESSLQFLVPAKCEGYQFR